MPSEAYRSANTFAITRVVIPSRPFAQRLFGKRPAKFPFALEMLVSGLRSRCEAENAPNRKKELPSVQTTVYFFARYE
jgi:hypothetical protein